MLTDLITTYVEECIIEAYSNSLFDDPSYLSKSALVPDDIKVAINRWAADMRLMPRRKVSKKKARLKRR